jgi:hypothetical protein
MMMHCAAEFFDGMTQCAQFDSELDYAHSGNTVTQK